MYGLNIGYMNQESSSEELKTVFISYNQAYHELVLRILRQQGVRGYTSWGEVYGQGSRGGEPHLGSHAWPTTNSALLSIVPASKVAPLLEQLRTLDEATPEQGLRAFVWCVEQSI